MSTSTLKYQEAWCLDAPEDPPAHSHSQSISPVEGQVWRSTSPIQSKGSVSRQSPHFSPNYCPSQGSPVKPKLCLGKDLGVSVLCFPLFSLARFFPLFLIFPVPGSPLLTDYLVVESPSPPFSFQPLDGNGSSLTSHHCFPKPEKMHPRTNSDTML